VAGAVTPVWAASSARAVPVKPTVAALISMADSVQVNHWGLFMVTSDMRTLSGSRENISV
jgi:hypothetical protein